MHKSNIKSITFLGTGPSARIPNLRCLATEKCKNCTNVANYRTCTSLLIRTEDAPILIDCGKDFHQQYVHFLNKLSASEKYIPEVLLTHSHPDAILGLDALMQMTANNQSIKIYCDISTKKYITDNFEYLFIDRKQNNGYLKCEEITIGKDLFLSNVKIVPYYVEHGDLRAVAYYIEDTILYVSDCSLFNLQIEPKILVIDCTTYHEKLFKHLSFVEVVEIVKRLKPAKTYLIGMTHDIDSKNLQKEADLLRMNIFLAHDNMEIEYKDLFKNE